MTVADLGGWVGTVMVLVAYLHVTHTKKTTRLFHLANLVSAVLIGWDGWTHQAWPVVALNAAWTLIAAWGFFHLV